MRKGADALRDLLANQLANPVRFVEQIEAMLVPPALPMAPYPAKQIALSTGETMVVRQATVDEVDDMLHWIQPLVWVDRDYFNIVAARLFAAEGLVIAA